MGFKEKIAFLMSLVFIVPGMAEASPFAGGDGSRENPYQISNIEQLQKMRYHLSVSENVGGLAGYNNAATSRDSSSTPATFPDPNLEAAIREALGIGPEVNIYRSDLEKLTTFSALWRSISDLTGLEYAVNLTFLRLEGNPITDISPLANLINLTSLRLKGDQITDISPLANLTNLTSLLLWRNPITDISPLANLINLTWLLIGSNQITDISPLTNLINLTGLWLGVNQITDISPLANLTNLTALSLTHNQITDITPLANLTHLIDLGLGNNQITDIFPLANLTNLTLLLLWGNQITDISPLANLPHLTWLALWRNQITDISPLANLVYLICLSFWHNSITDVSPLANLTNLTRLCLRNNQITDILPLANLINLTWLALENNQITDIFPLANLTYLTELLLGGNQISDLLPLANLINLTSLGLEGNQVSDILPLIQNPGLSETDEVDLRGNPLSGESLNIHIPQLEKRGVSVLAFYTVSFPDVSASVGATGVAVPITVDEAKGIAGFEFTVTFNPTILQAREAEVGDLTSGWTVESGINNEIGKIGIAGLNPLLTELPSGSGSLVKLIFDVVGNPGETTDLIFTRYELVDSQLATIPSRVDNGRLTVTAAIKRDLSADRDDREVSISDVICILRKTIGL